MYGERGRIGLLVPFINSVLEPDFQLMKPHSISVYATRLYARIRPVYEREIFLMELSENIEDTIKVLIPVISDAEAGVMLYGCTSGSFIHGLKWNEDLEQKMNAVSNGIPMLTTTGALLSAFTELNVKKISVVTPYPDIVNMKLQATLEESGFEVVSLKAKTFPTTGNAPLNASYNLAKEAYRTDADCLFISCTGFRAIENIDRLEQEIGKPVITSNQACMWACLNTLGYKEPVKGYGRLLNMIK